MPKTYLPSVFAGKRISTGIIMSQGAYDFETVWLVALGDRRNLMIAHAKLVFAAQDHAEFLDARTAEDIKALEGISHGSHRGRGGLWSNDRVRAAGYNLPEEYLPGNNNVESCARDPYGAQHALDGLLASKYHHDHVLGLGGFARDIFYGIGQKGNDYVLIACPSEVE